MKLKTRFFNIFLALCITLVMPPLSAAAETDARIPPEGVSLQLPQIAVTSNDAEGTVVGFDSQEWYVIGDAATGVNPTTNNITLLHKQDDVPEGGLYANHYGWSNVRAYVYLTPDGSNEPVPHSTPADEEFPEFQEYEGVHFALLWKPDPAGEPMLIRPLLEKDYGYGQYDNSRALYFAVDHNDPSEGKGFTHPIDYHGGSLQQRMEEIVAKEMMPKESALLTPRTVDLGEKGGKPTENQKFWPLSQQEYSIISKSKAAGYFDYYWLLAPSASNYDYGDTSLPAVVTDFTPPMVIGNSLYSAHDDGYGIVKQSGPVRPACSLNLENAWFATAASGERGKSAAVISLESLASLQSAGSLLAEGDPIKFTMKDGTQTLSVDNSDHTVLVANGKGSIKYSGASTGANQYVSCFIADKDGTPLYYGKLADCSAKSSGEIEISVPNELLDGTFKMYLYSEQDNGDNYTDFASDLIPISFEAQPQYSVTYAYGGNMPENAPEPPTAASASAGDVITIAAAPALDGWVFSGWTVKSPSGLAIESGSFIMPNSDVVLQGSWQPIGPVEAIYKTEHYKQNENGTYELAETDFPLYGELGKTVFAVSKDYDGYSVNNEKSTISGVVVEPTTENGEVKYLVLTVYYDKDAPTPPIGPEGPGESEPEEPAKPEEKPNEPDRENPDTGTAIPQTGDNGHPALWVSLLLISSGALTAVSLYNKKRRKAE